MERAMSRKKLVVLALVTAHLFCSKQDDADQAPPATIHVVQPLLSPCGAHASFGKGWFSIEVNADDASWRWMGEEGEINVTTQASTVPGHLRLEGWVPAELPSPTTLELRLDDKMVDSFVAPSDHFVREYDVSTPVAGDAVFTIHASVTAHPSGDSRSLGFALVGFSFRYPSAS